MAAPSQASLLKDKFSRWYGHCTDTTCTQPHELSASGLKLHANTVCFTIFNTILLRPNQTSFSYTVVFWDSKTVKPAFGDVTDAALTERLVKEKENDAFSKELLEAISKFISSNLPSS
jgi:hypothetical protein